MRTSLMMLCVVGLAVPAIAHHPDRECTPVSQRVDVIPPLGNHLPESYRRRYNRPTYVGGKIAYYIAPSSQEAMAWHKAEHRGDYDCDRGRVVPHYFYQKPYEALRIGGRKSVKPENQRPASGGMTEVRAQDLSRPGVSVPDAPSLLEAEGDQFESPVAPPEPPADLELRLNRIPLSAPSSEA